MTITMYDTLLQLPLFQGLGKNDITSILDKVKIHFSRRKAGDIVLRKGQACRDLVFLLNGSLMSETSDKDNMYLFYEEIDAPSLLEPYSLFGWRTEYASNYITSTVCDFVSIEKFYLLSELSNYEIIRLGRITVLERTVLLQEILFHLLLCRFRDIDVIIKYLVLFRQFERNFRRKGDIEDETEIIAVHPLYRRLVFSGKRLSHHMETVLFDISVEGFGNHIIDGIHKCGLAVYPFDQRHRYHTLAESLDFGLPPVFIKPFFLLVRIIVFNDGQGKLYIEIIRPVLFYFHISVF